MLFRSKDVKQKGVTIEEIAKNAMKVDLEKLAANAKNVLDEFDAIFKKN